MKGRKKDEEMKGDTRENSSLEEVLNTKERRPKERTEIRKRDK
jgi:hypothetical protein